jgi:hypothetical protein
VQITFRIPASVQLFMNVTLDNTDNIPTLRLGGPFFAGPAGEMWR